MKIDTKNNRTWIFAEDCMALRRKGETNASTVTRVSLTANDSPDNWEDCEYGEPEPTENTAT